MFCDLFSYWWHSDNDTMDMGVTACNDHSVGVLTGQLIICSKDIAKQYIGIQKFIHIHK